jgi:hypothetical protein
VVGLAWIGCWGVAAVGVVVASTLELGILNGCEKNSRCEFLYKITCDTRM